MRSVRSTGAGRQSRQRSSSWATERRCTASGPSTTRSTRAQEVRYDTAAELDHQELIAALAGLLSVRSARKNASARKKAPPEPLLDHLRTRRSAC